MSTQTFNIHLTKPDMSDPASPAALNNNFDIIDSQIGSLNGYKATVDGLVDCLTEIESSVENAVSIANTAVTTSNAYTDQAVGNISSVIDAISGEVV